jgi:aerobic-type carbon monoxide dehydrogenase small subunit (CoxS/CutS family)
MSSQPLTSKQISLTINGDAWSGEVPVNETLLEFVRERLSLTGTKRSCESEVCGACTLLVDGLPVSSCTYLVFEADGRTVTTIEGLAKDGQLDPLQEAFIREESLQCGYCTPGQIMAAKGLLTANATPSPEEITDWMGGNICRCGVYRSIARAVLSCAAEETNGG